jgi:menaquinone-9 beta-reductase
MDGESAVTFTLDEAARQVWSVLIVGAGPAGAVAARELARRGVDVLLVDRATFPRWKVCGCCLNGNALSTLERLGLGMLPKRFGACPLSDMCLSVQRREARIALAGSVALSRETFDAALIAEALCAGATFLPGTNATLADLTTSVRSVRLRNRDQEVCVAARVVLAADGLGGALLTRSGENPAPAITGARIGAGVVHTRVPDFYQPGTLYMTCGAGGYLGLVRLEDGRLDLAAAFDTDELRRRGNPGVGAATLLDAAGWPAPPDLHRVAWRGTPALMRQPRRLAAERIFVVGDAAGYIEPFTGEGMAWALASGVAVVPFAIRAAAAWQDKWQREWTQCYRRVVTRRQTGCRVAAAVLRHPLMAGGVVAVLSRVPVLAVPFIRYLNRSSPP